MSATPVNSDRDVPPAETAEQRRRRWRRNYEDELENGQLYRLLARHERDSTLGEVFLRIAATEDRHAALWRTKLEAAGDDVAPPRRSVRLRILALLARRFGAGAVLPLVRSLEVEGSRGYAGQPEPEAADMHVAERSHAITFAALATGRRPSDIPRIEGRHRTGGGNTLRAAVLGANDGLISNLSLVMGVAGADPGRGVVLLAGMSGLLAGALSMALGEWISVRSSQEALERQVGIEREELAELPDEEREELALIYRAKGLPAEEADRVAARIVENPTAALETLVREELGLDPEELGSPGKAAFSSFLLFVAGAIVPVLPYLALDDIAAVIASGSLSSLGLFCLGAAITLFTGRSAVASGLRQVGVGLAAAVVTFGLGRLLGVATGL